jgi:signal transduction histidine kinase
VQYVHLVTRLASLARKHWFDLLIAIAVLEGALEVAFRHDALREPRSSAWFAVPAIALVVLPLAARRRYPFAAPVSVWLVGAAVSFIDGRLVLFTASVFLAGAASAFLLGNLRDDVQGRLGLAVVLSSAAIVVYNDPNHAFGDLIFIPLLFAMVRVAGFALRERPARAEAAEHRALLAEREQAAAARVAAAEERGRIARELHDIVAHAVSVMVLQVGAVRHKLPDGLEEDRAALTGVEHTGRAALVEMRRLLGAMRTNGEEAERVPKPGLGSLEGLLADVERAGLPVRAQVNGKPAQLPRGSDMSACRIVQEGLTNALKHAHAGQAVVAVDYRPQELRIGVRDNGGGPPVGDGRGHGLIGIGERVKLYCGEMRTGTAADGGFALATRLPLTDDPS